MSGNKENKPIDVKDLTELLMKHIKISNNQLMESFVSKLSCIVTVICLLPFIIKLATESTRQEIFCGFVMLIALRVIYHFKDYILNLFQHQKDRD